MDFLQLDLGVVVVFVIWQIFLRLLMYFPCFVWVLLFSCCCCRSLELGIDTWMDAQLLAFVLDMDSECNVCVSKQRRHTADASVVGVN